MDITLKELMSLLEVAYKKGCNGEMKDCDGVVEDIVHNYANHDEFTTFICKFSDGITPNKNGNVYLPMNYEVKLPSGDVMNMFDVAPPIIVKNPDSWDESWGE